MLRGTIFKQGLKASAFAGVGIALLPQPSQAAEVKVGMYMPFLVGGADSDNQAENQIGLGTTDTEFYLTGSEMLENGIKVALRFEMNADADTSEVNSDETEIEISGGFGLISLGHEDGPADLLNYGATNVKSWVFGSYNNTTGIPVNFSQYSGAPTTGNEAGLDSGDNVKAAYYTPRFYGVQFGASWSNTSEIIAQTPASNAEAVELGANFSHTFGGVELGTALTYWSTDQSHDAERYTISALLGFQNFGLAGSYAKGERPNGQDVLSWDIGLGYETDRWAAHITYEVGEADFLNAGTASGDADLLHMGVSYVLGPGITVGASLGFGSDEADQGSLNAGQSKDYTLFTTGILVSF